MKQDKNVLDMLRDRKINIRKPILRASRTKEGNKARLIVFAAITAAVVIVAFLGRYISPCDPLATDFSAALVKPGPGHVFGTDSTGRDVLSRVLSGAANSFALTFIMIAIIAAIGTFIGLMSGFFGGILDAILMRLTDVLLAFPTTVFAIAVVGIVGAGLFNTVVALSLVWWTKYARVTRGLSAEIRSKDYIAEARLGGAKTGKILRAYILPNILPRVIVMCTMDIGGMMLALAGLSFLGLASQPPAPEWGYMLFEGRSYMQVAPWLMIFPGVAIFITVIVFNLLGDSIRDVLDPKDT
ncbi:MAG: ABC transporter permease [Clostridiales bacterium]|nr:ABC transporter permease [Clostridiales bacterium]